MVVEYGPRSYITFKFKTLGEKKKHGMFSKTAGESALM